jgi:ketosteroid isomerase-like protein
MIEETVIDRMYAGLAAGDVKAALACFTPDAVIWHGFDRIKMSLAEAAPGWEAMISHFPERFATNVRCQPTPTGFVQQHEWHVRTADGKSLAWPLCIVVEIRDGLIARLDEYIDRAGSFEA